MSDREFVDTNVLIYALDLTAGKKREAAVSLLERLWTQRLGCVSIQVLQEFYAAATKKLGLPSSEASVQIERLGKWMVHRPSAEDVVRAIQLHRAGNISFRDAMILRSAISSGCGILWSEDLADGQPWQGTTVRNPFAG